MAGGGGGFGRSFRPGGDDLKDVKITWPMLKRVFSYFRPYWLQFTIVITSIIISSTLGVVPSLLMQKIVDEAFPNQNMNQLIMLVVVSFFALVTLNLMGILENYINSWISQHIIHDMKNQMYKHLQSMPHSFFITQKQGDIITRMNNDINGVQGIISTILTQLIKNLFVVVTTSITLFALNWKLALLGIIIIPTFIIPTKKVGKVRWSIVRKAHEKQDEMNQVVQETLSVSGSLLTKLFTKEEEEYSKFAEINKNIINYNIKESLAGRWFFTTIHIITGLSPLLMYLLGGYLIIVRGDNILSIGVIISCVNLLNRLYQPTSSLFNTQVEVTRSMALFQRIFEYFDTKVDIKDSKNSLELKECDGNISFNDVSFYYEQGQPILKNISFEANEGEMVALVGPSGAGKSTIINLIPRLFDVKSGAITLDGEDIRNIKLKSLRTCIGAVTQDTYLFNGTIRENLLYANEGATDEDLINACKAANIHELIDGLPQKYETIVGNRGIKLSGGEKQRISIARIILRNPKVLILDEATSALDSVSETLIQEALEPLMKGRTTIVIAHRLSTILSANKILVVKNGEIVEQGTHNELLELGKEYKELFETQFKKVLELES